MSDKPNALQDAIAAGDSVIMNEQAALLRKCRAALDSLLEQRPGAGWLVCGSTTIGNLRAELYEYRPKGVFGCGLLTDTDRINWLASRKKLSLVSEGMRWTREDGSSFVSPFSLSATNTQFAPAETLRELIDKAMALDPTCA